MKIAVIGAGPAGLICAWQLSRQQHDITVFEKKPHLGAQGSGVLIQPIGLSVLDHLGIRDDVEALGQRVNRILGYSGFDQSHRVIDADYRLLKKTYDYALGINRSALWSVLHNKMIAQKNVRLHTNVNISRLHHQTLQDGRRRVVAFNHNDLNCGAFDLIIDASGANTKLRHHATHAGAEVPLQYGSLWTTLTLPDDSPYAGNTMVVYSGEKNQGIGIMPTGKTTPKGVNTATLFFNIDLEKYSNWNDDTFKKWKSDTVEKWPNIKHLLLQINDHKQLHIAKFRHHTLPNPSAEKIVFIGDAAHCSAPQLGQGINMSLVDALLLANTIDKSSNTATALEKYAQRRKPHVFIYQTLAKFLAPFYQSDNGLAILARNSLFGLFSKLHIFKLVTTLTLSGRLGSPLKSLK